jgi:aldose 1-epimerase
MSDQRIRLTCGTLTAEVAPDVGGALTAFAAGDQALLRPALASGPYAGRPLGMACFPMLPFANRIASGRFAHDGREYRIARNVSERHPLHGHGWQGRWSVIARTACSTRLEFRGGAEWPWPYVAVEEITLVPRGITITLDFRNLGNRAAPVTLGLHPYFRHGGSLQVETTAAGVWEPDVEGIPVAFRPLSESGPASLPVEVARSGLDHCFDGWTGHARLRWPRDGTALVMEAWGSRCLHVYAPADQDYVCLEPVTARPDAFNPRPDDLAPAPVVSPGESVVLGLRLRVDSTTFSAAARPRAAGAPLLPA